MFRLLAVPAHNSSPQNLLATSNSQAISIGKNGVPPNVADTSYFLHISTGQRACSSLEVS